MGYAANAPAAEPADLQIIKSGAEWKTYTGSGSWSVAASAEELNLQTDEIAVIDATHACFSDDLLDLYVYDGNGVEICWPLTSIDARTLVWIWQDGGVWYWSRVTWGGTSGTVYADRGQLTTADPTTGLQWVMDILPMSSGTNHSIVTIGKIKRSG